MSDPNQAGPVTGPEKSHALSGLKADLLALTHLTDQAGVSDPALAYLSHPNFTDESLEVRQRISEVLVVSPEQLTSHSHLPMPGDPERILVVEPDSTEVPYYLFAKKQVLAPLEDMAKRFGVMRGPVKGQVITGLLGADFDAIKFELTRQFEFEFEKNSAASDRVRQKWNDDPGSISLDEAVLSEKVRGVSATTLERAELLIMHPEMDAIEDYKIICTLDPYGYYDAIADYRDNLSRIGEESQRYLVVLIPTDEQAERPRHLGGSAHKNVRAQKRVIAEIYDSKGDAVIEVVEKLNEYAFPVDQVLKGIVPHIVDGKNVLPVYSQIVLRVKRDRSSEADVKDAADQAGMFIPRGMSSVAMKIDSMRNGSSTDS
jgi:hypothetical protein